MIGRAARGALLVCLHAALAPQPARAATSTSAADWATALAQATARSPQLARARLEAAEAEFANTRAWYTLGPTLRAQGSALVQQPYEFGGEVFRESTGVTAGLHWQQPVFRRTLFAALERAEVSRERARLAVARAEATVAHALGMAALELTRSRALVDQGARAIARAEARRNAAEARVKAGGALRTTLLEASLALRSAQLTRARAARDARVAELAFEELVGAPAPAHDLAVPELPALSPAELDVRARQRPDLRAAERSVAESLLDEDVASSGLWWPRVDVVAAVDVVHPAVFDALDWSVVGTLTIPLFEGGSERVALQEAELRTRARTIAEEELRRAIDADMARAAHDARAAEELWALANAQVAEAYEHLRMVEEQYRLGVVDHLEFEAASTSLDTAELSAIEATAARARARWDLYHAAGVTP